MKWFLPAVLVSLPFSLFANHPLYEREIIFSSPAAKPAAETLSRLLGEMTGEEFKVVVGSDEAVASKDAIQLWSAQEAEAIPALKSALAQLDKSNPEAFVIESSANEPGLRMVARHGRFMNHAVYRYLQELGYRSLMPGPNWQIVPRRADIRLDRSLAEAPHYNSRVFFGTGGFHTRLPLDPDAKIAGMWRDWQAANLYASSINLPGHYGEAFVHKNKEVLEANPDYRAMINGERVPMSTQFQINYGNPALRELYVKDRLADMATLVQRTPDLPHSVSVDPADGGGHCESPESLALGSVSDRVFGLANEVARKVNEEFPGNFVNLYAYNFHAGAPKFRLEDNVIVSLVPYGFNRSEAEIGDDLIIAWKKVASRIGIYDYLSLPDWSRGCPTADFRTELPRRLKLWTESNARYVNFESTTGAGTSGIALYLAGKVLWNPQTDYHQELEQYYTIAFGSARAPMQRMLERWAGGFALNYNELGLAYRDLKEAYALSASSPEVKARVEDYITYVHYLRLLWQFDIAPVNSTERLDAANALTRFIWQIRENAMVQTFRIHQLMRNGWLKANEAYFDAWDFANPEASGWATVPAHYPTSSEIGEYLANGETTYPVYFEPRTFSTDLVPINAVEGESTADVTSFMMMKQHSFLFTPTKSGELKLSVRFPDTRSTTLDMKAIVKVSKAEGDQELLRLILPLDGEWHPITAQVTEGVTYRLFVNDRTAKFNLQLPSDLPIVVESGFLPLGWTNVKGYFYVPEGTKRFGIFARGNPVTEHTAVRTDGNDVVDPIEEQGGLAIYEVGDADGQIWSVEKLTSSYHIRFLNIPNHLAFSQEAVMVPKELLKE